MKKLKLTYYSCWGWRWVHYGKSDGMSLDTSLEYGILLGTDDMVGAEVIRAEFSGADVVGTEVVIAEVVVAEVEKT